VVGMCTCRQHHGGSERGVGIAVSLQREQHGKVRLTVWYPLRGGQGHDRLAAAAAKACATQPARQDEESK
jgi:hypothetical protein